MLTITITAILEFAGYTTRVLMLHKPSVGLYAMMQALLIISPVLLSIVNYIVAGRILRYVDTSKGWLRPAWVGGIFTASDIICLILQGAGGGMSASQDASQRTLGKNLLLAGLAIQIVFFTMFLCVTIYINRCKVYGLSYDKRFRPVFIGLYSTIGLMYIRNVFRFIEFTQGYDGYLASHETYFYIFDFALIFSSCLLYLCFHFGLYMSPERLLRPVAGHELDSTSASRQTKKSVADISASSSTTEPVPRPNGASFSQGKHPTWV